MSQLTFGAKGRERVSQYLRRTQGRNRHRLPYRKDLVKKPSRPAKGARSDEKWGRMLNGYMLIRLFGEMGMAYESR